MADATITLKLTPVEFDAVREALTFGEDYFRKAALKSKEFDAPARADARRRTAQYGDLLLSLKNQH